MAEIKVTLTKTAPARVTRAAPLALSLVGAFLLHAADPHPPATKETCDLPPALAITLFAAEPDVVDPVALTFDEDGRVFVVEMRDYPLGIGPNHQPGGTIRLLEDRDGDGKADHSTVFAEGLSFPTSIAPWNGGVLVTAPPEIIFLKDTNGDGKADVREVVLKGFQLGVTDSNVNGLRWGIDNRVHGANGGNGGVIISSRQPGPPISIRNLDFSFDPATGDFTPTYHTGAGFGLVFDDWGRSFVTYNINHIQHRVLPVRYLQRFPGLPPVQATVNIADHGEAARIYPISVPATRVNHPEQAGYFSSAGGIGYLGGPIYRGDLAGSVLVCDVVGNLVHRDILIEDGPSFVARRAPGELKQEFFASRDNAFRPVGVELGPDGALYLIDMQRDVIEHPDYIPSKVKEKLNLRAGEDRGRIYRITPKGGLLFKKPNLRQVTTATLVNELGNPNQWWRITAQRLLMERQDKRAVPLVKKAVTSEQRPLGRLHALWTLRGLNALDETLVHQALNDDIPEIREHALVLAEPFAAHSRALQERILSLASDRASRVRFQAALTIGEFELAGKQAALLQILSRDYQYRWTRLAVLSSLQNGAEELFKSLIADEHFRQANDTNAAACIRELAGLIGARAGQNQGFDAALVAFGNSNLPGKTRVASLEGLQEGLARANGTGRTTAEAITALRKIMQTGSPVLVAAAWKIARALGLPDSEAQRTALVQASALARDQSRSPDERVEQIRLLALGSFPVVKSALIALLDSSAPAPVQLAAIEALSNFSEPEVATALVQNWRRLTPSARPAVVQLLLQRGAFHEFLITAIERGQIQLGELNLDLEQRRRLLRRSSPEIQARAAKLFGDEEYSNRKSLVEEWLKKLPAAGNAQQGRAVFEKNCALCHAVGGQGNQVGPDLTDAYHRSLEDLVSNILDPNMAINPNYASSNVELNSGESETGILRAESPEAITLLQAMGKQKVIPRKNIKSMSSSGISLMPEGLEAAMTPQELRDLVAFLQEKRG